MSELYLDKFACPHCGQWIDDDYPSDERDAKATELQRIVNQVDDELVVNWITVKDGDYRKALRDLVAQGIQIENDPAVSSTAKARQEEMAALQSRITELEDALKLLEPFFKSDALMNRTNWHFAPARGERVQRAILAARAALYKPEK